MSWTVLIFNNYCEMTVSERLKKVRVEEKLSQNEFAEKLNVSRSTLMLIEQGKREVNTKVLEALKKEFNISADWLLFGETAPEMDLNPLIEDFNKSNELLTILEIYVDSWVELVIFHAVKAGHDKYVMAFRDQLSNLKKDIVVFQKSRVIIYRTIAEYTINASSDLENSLRSAIKVYFKHIYALIDSVASFGNISKEEWASEVIDNASEHFFSNTKEIKR